METGALLGAFVAGTAGVLGLCALLLSHLKECMPARDRQLAWFVWWLTALLVAVFLVLGSLPARTGAPPGATPFPTPPTA